MDMDQAAIFLSGSILTMLGFIVIAAGIVAINNLLHRFWKPVTLWKFDPYPPQFIDSVDPRFGPAIEPEKTPNKKSTSEKKV